jgi:hypothetical protein
MERRSFWDRLLGRLRPELYRASMVEASGSMFTRWLGDPYASDIVRAAQDAVARNAAKLRPRHIRRVEGKVIPTKSTVDRLLSIRPNPVMSTYDLLYKSIITLLGDNNAFQLPEWDDDGNLVAIWPVTCSRWEFIEDATGGLFVRFWSITGKQLVRPYPEGVIHLRRHFGKGEYSGDSKEPINATLDVISTTTRRWRRPPRPRRSSVASSRFLPSSRSRTSRSSAMSSWPTSPTSRPRAVWPRSTARVTTSR